VPQIARQLRAEGVSTIVVVTDEPRVPERRRSSPHGVDPPPRRARRRAARTARMPGVTVLIYDQTCAAEKRRRRKRGKLADPPRRVFINEPVCEGCGDCGVQIQLPVGDAGRNRVRPQARHRPVACNKDFSCVKGFCPSFVTVEGGSVRRGRPCRRRRGWPSCRAAAARHRQPFNILITGVGGTGVVTIGALLGMAAHLDGKGVSVLDMTGLAQKYGAVFSHLRIADDPGGTSRRTHRHRRSHAVIGGDLVVAAP
jgi:indolepyruvate ferredoxin oxidoreductase